MSMKLNTNVIRGLGCLLAVTIAEFACGDAAPKPREVFDRYFAAVGGREAFQKVETILVQATTKEGDQELKVELAFKPPGRFLLTASNGEGFTIRRGRDAQAKWWRQDPSGVADIGEREVGDLMDLAVAYSPYSQVFLAGKLADAVCSVEQDGDRSVVVVGEPSATGPFPQMAFDRQTSLMVKVGGVMLSDYRTVEGCQFPFHAQTKRQEPLLVKEIRVNPPLEDKQFEKPAGLSASEIDRRSQESYHTRLSAAGKLELVRQPKPANFGRGKVRQIASWDPKSPRHAQVDLRGADLTGLDLSERLTDLLHADFDAVTRWPAAFPKGFDSARVSELGKDPGLGVRELHRRGITGKGMGLGIIDQTLLVDHVEYGDRLRLYEEIHSPAAAPAQMHGPAVASIAVGRTVGVAPGADLYYIAEMHGTMKGQGQFDWNFTWLAQAIERLLDINQTLPPERRMRAISISVGWSPDQQGFAEANRAVERATKEGVFVISTAIEQTHRLAFHGLGRPALADPNVWESYAPGSWWAPAFCGGQFRPAPGKRLLVPMDARTTASPTGTNDYVHYDSSGWSWAVPWIAGLYTLACEVKPDLTPELFWGEAMKTGRTTQVERDGETIPFGTLADPVALIETLQKR
jgi:hypothetical protein